MLGKLFDSVCRIVSAGRWCVLACLALTMLAGLAAGQAADQSPDEYDILLNHPNAIPNSPGLPIVYFGDSVTHKTLDSTWLSLNVARQNGVIELRNEVYAPMMVRLRCVDLSGGTKYYQKRIQLQATKRVGWEYNGASYIFGNADGFPLKPENGNLQLDRTERTFQLPLYVPRDSAGTIVVTVQEGSLDILSKEIHYEKPVNSDITVTIDLVLQPRSVETRAGKTRVWLLPVCDPNIDDECKLIQEAADFWVQSLTDNRKQLGLYGDTVEVLTLESLEARNTAVSLQESIDSACGWIKQRNSPIPYGRQVLICLAPPRLILGANRSLGRIRRLISDCNDTCFATSAIKTNFSLVKFVLIPYPNRRLEENDGPIGRFCRDVTTYMDLPSELFTKNTHMGALDYTRLQIRVFLAHEVIGHDIHWDSNEKLQLATAVGLRLFFPPDSNGCWYVSTSEEAEDYVTIPESGATKPKVPLGAFWWLGNTGELYRVPVHVKIDFSLMGLLPDDFTLFDVYYRPDTTGLENEPRDSDIHFTTVTLSRLLDTESAFVKRTKPGELFPKYLRPDRKSIAKFRDHRDSPAANSDQTDDSRSKSATLSGWRRWAKAPIVQAHATRQVRLNTGPTTISFNVAVGEDLPQRFGTGSEIKAIAVVGCGWALVFFVFVLYQIFESKRANNLGQMSRRFLIALTALAVSVASYWMVQDGQSWLHPAAWVAGTLNLAFCIFSAWSLCLLEKEIVDSEGNVMFSEHIRWLEIVELALFCFVPWVISFVQAFVLPTVDISIYHMLWSLGGLLFVFSVYAILIHTVKPPTKKGRFGRESILRFFAALVVLIISILLGGYAWRDSDFFWDPNRIPAPTLCFLLLSLLLSVYLYRGRSEESG